VSASNPFRYLLLQFTRNRRRIAFYGVVVVLLLIGLVFVVDADVVAQRITFLAAPVIEEPGKALMTAGLLAGSVDINPTDDAQMFERVLSAEDAFPEIGHAKDSIGRSQRPSVGEESFSTLANNFGDRIGAQSRTTVFKEKLLVPPNSEDLVCWGETESFEEENASMPQRRLPV
jgi:hypothetical protein